MTFNAEEVFNLDSSLVVLRAEAMYRPGKSLRHQLDFTYASYHRDGSGTLDEEIDINGTTYPVGAQVDTLFDFDIIRGTYTYAVLQDERMRIALGLGLYAIPVEYGLSIETTGGGDARLAGFRTRFGRERIHALPDLRYSGQHFHSDARHLRRGECGAV